MNTISDIKGPPHYAAIFTNQLKPDADKDGLYEQTAMRMVELATQQPGYLGHDGTRNPDGMGITVSYWQDLEAIKNWQQNAEHLIAQKLGIDKFYQAYTLRVCKVETVYAFGD